MGEINKVSSAHNNLLLLRSQHDLTIRVTAEISIQLAGSPSLAFQLSLASCCCNRALARQNNTQPFAPHFLSRLHHLTHKHSRSSPLPSPSAAAAAS